LVLPTIAVASFENAVDKSYSDFAWWFCLNSKSAKNEDGFKQKRASVSIKEYLKRQ
jgi:hypothetical protein